jgi:hypothetical protein
MKFKQFIKDYFIFIFIWVVFLMGVSFICIEQHYIRHYVMPICAADKFSDAMPIRSTEEGLKRYACVKKGVTPRNLIKTKDGTLIWEDDFKY